MSYTQTQTVSKQQPATSSLNLSELHSTPSSSPTKMTINHSHSNVDSDRCIMGSPRLHAGPQAVNFSFYKCNAMGAVDAVVQTIGTICEPTPFRDGTSLQPSLSGFKTAFVPTNKTAKEDITIDITSPMSFVKTEIPTDTEQISDLHDESPSSPPPRVISRCFEHQEQRWEEHFQNLLRYRQHHGNSHVPQNYPQDLALARWARRQRHQYKLKHQNKKSSMSDERQHLLEQVGFIWDPQTDCWEIRRQELEEYKEIHGHCNVPSRYSENSQLATWVKRQRRQHKQMLILRKKGHSISKIIQQRFDILAGMGFVWAPRNKSGVYEYSTSISTRLVHNDM